MKAQIQRNSKAYLCKDSKNVIPAIKITNSALDYEKKTTTTKAGTIQRRRKIFFSTGQNITTIRYVWEVISGGSRIFKKGRALNNGCLLSLRTHIFNQKVLLQKDFSFFFFFFAVSFHLFHLLPFSVIYYVNLK